MRAVLIALLLAPAALAAEPSNVTQVVACGSSPWSTYGKDAQRTSASDGCLDETAAVAWRFAPPKYKGRLQRMHHVIAERDAVFVTGTRGQSPIVHRLDPDGAKIRWDFDSRADISRMEWPTVSRGIVMFVDDGCTRIDRETGVHKTALLDMWGSTIIDNARIYVVNKWQEEGPSLFVGAFDDSLKKLWKSATFSARGVVVADSNGIALDNGVLFHAANYHFDSHSFVSALDPETGKPLWRLRVTPKSSVSASYGKIFLVEQRGKGHALVSRDQQSGDVTWETPIKTPLTAQAPVLANGVVIVQTDEAIIAVDAQRGALVWQLSLPSKAPKTFNATTLAAALGSRTLVVTANGFVNLVDLSDGHLRTRLGTYNEVHSPIVVGDAGYVIADDALLRLQNRGLSALTNRTQGRR